MPLNPIMRMTLTILKNVVMGSDCKMYPFRKPEYHANTRGPVVIEKEKCILCTLCAKRCPTGAIEVDRKAGVWKIDHLKCIYCGACVECCPKKCLSMTRAHGVSVAEKQLAIVSVDVPKPPPKAPAEPKPPAVAS